MDAENRFYQFNENDVKNLKISVQNGVKKCQNGGNGVLNMWMASIKYIHSTTYSSFLLLIFHPFL